MGSDGKGWQKCLCFLLLIVFVSKGLSQDDPEFVMVDISQGTLQGIKQNGYTKFLGVPFAKPPVGDLRFKKPQPHSGWEGVRQAVEFGNNCLQPSEVFAQAFPSDIVEVITKGNYSEDCLFLDIYIPGAVEDAKQDAKVVMVWIHGGGFTLGSAGSGGFTSGEFLATKGDVIVVGMNYRLGPLGFLTLDHPDTPGNVGLLDQQFAMKWVRDNIAEFGGNPNMVTIFGESAGAMSVSCHVLSPSNAGLFHRAISESGTCGEFLLSQEFIYTSTTLPLLTQVGCSMQNKTDIPACLRRTSGEQLVKAAGFTAGLFYPRVDGEFIPQEPRIIYEKGLFNKVPNIVGFTSGKQLFKNRNVNKIKIHNHIQGPFCVSVFQYTMSYKKDPTEGPNCVVDTFAQYLTVTFICFHVVLMI